MKKLILIFIFAAGFVSARAEKFILRVGYFPNITHAQGIIASDSTRRGHGWFEERLGPDVTVQWYAFNAGPSAMEAIFAGSIDLTYVGPNPALNAYIRSDGDEIRVLAGAAVGGAALVVGKGSNLAKPGDFRGKRIATPQFGNTQDVAARAWLKRNGLRVTVTGGDASVIPTANPDQLALLQQGRIDAVWTVEPWVSRLEIEAGAKVLLEQNDAVTTVLVSSVRLLKIRPDLAEKFRAAHARLTEWINAHPDEAKAQVRAGLTAEFHREMPVEIVASAWRRLHFTAQIDQRQFQELVRDAQSVGFLRDAIPLDRMFSQKP